MAERLDTDLAVLEQRFGYGEWRVLGYIGPDRDELRVTQEVLHTGMSIRVRYLDLSVQSD